MEDCQTLYFWKSITVTLYISEEQR
jgi:hypothetical protein